ncbi:MAG: NUDIX domain-containing protein [Clostridia bacterium]|nr:NUDIX domain-containing protein [Clostridia bacterium]
MQDCHFTAPGIWFRFRAAAVIIEDGCVLLASNDAHDYYYSVGGGVHAGETAKDAVIRETYEETGVMYEVDRLLFVHENFFLGEDNKTHCHEISFYFLMKSRGTKELNSNSYCAYGKEHMNWIPIKDLKNHTAYPVFFADKLQNLPCGIEHIVTSEL